MQLIEGLFCLERKGLGCSVLPVITPVHHQGLLVYTHCDAQEKCINQSPCSK